MDATGLTVYGAGEWKVRSHDWSRRRIQAAKLQVGVDGARGEMVVAVVTTKDDGAGQRLPEWLDQIDRNIAPVSGDGAYDLRDGYQAMETRKARAALPPRCGARIWPHGN